MIHELADLDNNVECRLDNAKLGFDGNMLCSIAISLKRIADTLDKHPNAHDIAQSFNDIQQKTFNDYMDKMINNKDNKEHSQRDDLK